MTGEVDIVALIQEDVALTRRGREFIGLCPFHNEKTPSFTVKVEVDRPFYHCFGCSAHGDAVQWLVDYKGMSMSEALAFRDGKDATRPKGGVDSSSQQPAKPEPKKKKAEFIEKLPENHEGRYEYRDAEGKLKFVVQRYWIAKDEKKSFGQYTRARKGETRGWVKELAMEKDRPLYRLAEVLAAPPERQIMVVEGEKCVHAVVEASGKALPICWAGGSGAWRKTDWSPLYGRPVLLVADGQSDGHKCMKDIARFLRPQCPEIFIVLPPLNKTGEKPRDIADEIEDGANISKWLRDHGKEYTEEAPAAAPESTAGGLGGDDDIQVADEFGNNSYFRLLGNVDSMVAIKLWTNQVVMASRQSMCSRAQLLSLAPDVNWWITNLYCDQFSNNVALIAGAGLLRLADKLGQVDVSRVMNRGRAQERQGRSGVAPGRPIAGRGRGTDAGLFGRQCVRVRPGGRH